MTTAKFLASTQETWSGVLLALWWDGHGDWERAHTVAQDLDGRDGAWVHAYLHRKEGDHGNATYWYRRAGRPVATGELQPEWERIVADLLDRRSQADSRQP